MIQGMTGVIIGKMFDGWGDDAGDVGKDGG